MEFTGKLDPNMWVAHYEYTGTMDQWKNVFLYRGAFKDSALEEVICSGGTLKFKKSK